MKFTLLLLMFLISLPVQAAELASKGQARDFADDVMKDVAAGRVDAALRSLKIYATVPAEEFGKIEEEIKFQLPGMEKRFGTTVGFEFISEKSVGKSLYSLNYLQKFEKHAVRWRFLFYKPGDKWLLNSFATDDNLQELFTQ
jgi:hypothetical protein